MSEVLLGQSYYLRFDPKLWRAMQPYPPLGTLFAAGYLRRNGHSVALFDAMLADGEEAWDQALEMHRPRFAVLYEDNFNYLSKMCLSRMREAAFTMIAMARRRGAVTLVCGSDATDNARAYLDAGAQLVIHGEGEATLAEALEVLQDAGVGASSRPGRDAGPAPIPALARVAGLTVAPELRGDGETEPLRTAPRKVLSDLDALPPPAWDLADVERYRRIWLERHGHFSLNLATTRGCPYHCNWCAKPIWGQTYHMRGPEHVAEELAEVRERYRVDHVWFADDIFGLKRGWIAAFADAVAARRARTPFKCLSRADLLCRSGEVEALARAGGQSVWIGAESGSQKILDAMEKGTTVEQIREAARRVQAAGMRIGFFLQFGYPGETREDVDATRALVRECRPDEIGMSVSYPLPGTAFYQRVELELGARRNWVDSEDLAMLYRGPFTTAFYRQLHRVVSKEFRARLAGDALREVLRRPGDLRARDLRRAAVWAYHRATLPFSRLELERRARRPHRGIAPLAGTRSYREAAVPTPQGER